MIVRAETAPKGSSFDRTSALAFRLDGLGAIDARVWLIHSEVSRAIRGPLATTWGRAVTPKGDYVILWLKNVAILVVTGEYAGHVGTVLAGFPTAIAEIWPATKPREWPFSSSILESTVFEALGMNSNKQSRFFNRKGIKRGKQAEYVFKIDGRLPASDFYHEVLAQRMAKAIASGQWSPRQHRAHD